MSPCEDRRSWAAISIEHRRPRFQIGAGAARAGAPAVGWRCSPPLPRNQKRKFPLTLTVYVIAMAVLALLALLVAGGVAAIVIAVRRARRAKALPQQPAAGHGVTPPPGYGQQPQHPGGASGNQPR